jgi:hypothetical protein
MPKDPDDESTDEDEPVEPETHPKSNDSYIFDVVEGQLGDLKNVLNLIFKVIEDPTSCPTVAKAM